MCYATRDRIPASTPEVQYVRTTKTTYNQLRIVRRRLLSNCPGRLGNSPAVEGVRKVYQATGRPNPKKRDADGVMVVVPWGHGFGMQMTSVLPAL